MTPVVEIVGSGPAGLAAALTIAKQGGHAIVYERHADVGCRFHGDFQGLEDWTTEGDVLEELASIGVEPTFDYTPFRECVLFGPDGHEQVCRADRPIWYLVRRGPGPGTLDQGLKAQALAAGVEFRFNSARHRLPAGGIVAHGPRRVDAVAAGFVFETDRVDGAFVAASDKLAPKGYAYLLICGGKATIASCTFADFRNAKTYLKRTVDFFCEKVGINMTKPRPFGGSGRVFPTRDARSGKTLYVGEAAGFQDALFGFGMRYAMLSGHLAARAWLEDRPDTYDRLWQDRFGGLLKTAVVNRYFYERSGEHGYARLLRHIGREPDVRNWLCRYYGSSRLKGLFYPLARASLRKPGMTDDEST